MYSHSQRSLKNTTTATTSSIRLVKSICLAATKDFGTASSLRPTYSEGKVCECDYPERDKNEALCSSDPAANNPSIPSLVTLDSKTPTSSSSSMASLCLALCTLKLEDDSTTDSRLAASHSSSVFCGAHEEIDGCMDIEITQMDIVRMSRSAASILGLSSLSQLPILKYEPRDDHFSTQSNIFFEDEQEQVLESGLTAICDVKKRAKAGDSSDRLCAICLLKIVRGEIVRMLPCGRCIHAGCIERCTSTPGIEEQNDGRHLFVETLTSSAEVRKISQTISCELGAEDSTNATLDSTVHLSSSLEDSVMDDEIPSWTFVKIGSSLEGDLDETICSHESILLWSFEQVGDAL